MNEPCCGRSPWYNLRRYDPLGRTLWIRDYFAGATGMARAITTGGGCRMIVKGERIFVIGPTCWTRADHRSTWWNAACYTTDGHLLWKSLLGGVDRYILDVATVNGCNYAITESPVWDFPGILAGLHLNTAIVTFDDDGRTLDVIALVAAVLIGPFLTVGNPSTVYGGIGLPAGLLTRGIYDLYATAAVWDPSADDFVVGLQNQTIRSQSGGITHDVNRAIFRAPPLAASSIINQDWMINATWGLSRITYLAGETSPYDMALTPDGGVFIAAAFAPYDLDPPDPGHNVVLEFGSGLIARLSAAGNLVWLRGSGVATCLAADAQRLYVGSSAAQPSLMRWSHDGDYLWGHRHQSVIQLGLIDDRGSVSLGTRRQFGVDETHWVPEPKQ